MAAKKKESIDEMPLEEAFSNLDTILQKLESPDISLEESFQKYQEGMKLLKHCNDTIDQVEKKVMQINAEGKPEESETLSGI